jgi:hypothetical protein
MLRLAYYLSEKPNFTCGTSQRCQMPPSQRRPIPTSRDGRLAQTHIGVVAWSRTGNPDLGDWGPPEVLVRIGVIPEEFEAPGGVEWCRGLTPIRCLLPKSGHEPFEARMPHHAIVRDLGIRNLGIEAWLTHVVSAFLSGFANGAMVHTRGSSARRISRVVSRSHPVPTRPT